MSDLRDPGLLNILIAIGTLLFLLVMAFVCKKITIRTEYNTAAGIDTFRPNSPSPLMDNWKVMDDSSVNFHDKFFLHFLLNFSRK